MLNLTFPYSSHDLKLALDQLAITQVFHHLESDAVRQTVRETLSSGQVQDENTG